MKVSSLQLNIFLPHASEIRSYVKSQFEIDLMWNGGSYIQLVNFIEPINESKLRHWIKSDLKKTLPRFVDKSFIRSDSMRIEYLEFNHEPYLILNLGISDTFVDIIELMNEIYKRFHNNIGEGEVPPFIPIIKLSRFYSEEDISSKLDHLNDKLSELKLSIGKSLPLMITSYQFKDTSGSFIKEEF